MWLYRSCYETSQSPYDAELHIHLYTLAHFDLELLEGLQTNTLAAAAAKSLQLCLTLCNPIDGSPPGTPIPGILQARILEWVVISFSSAWKWKVKGKSLSHVRLLTTPWTAAYQAPPSMGFSRQEYWSGLPNTLEILVKIHSLLWSQTWWIIYSSCGVRNLWAFLLILMHIQVWEPLK